MDDPTILLQSIDAGSLVLLVVLSLPPLFVLASKRISGSRKTFWFIATSLLSWLAYIPFIILTRDQAAVRQESEKNT